MYCNSMCIIVQFVSFQSKVSIELLKKKQESERKLLRKLFLFFFIFSSIRADIEGVVYLLYHVKKTDLKWISIPRKKKVLAYLEVCLHSDGVKNSKTKKK